jgi:hypothetical protein
MNNPGGVPRHPEANVPELEELPDQPAFDFTSKENEADIDFGPPPPLIFDTGTILDSASVRLHRALLDGAPVEDIDSSLTQMLTGEVRTGGFRFSLLHLRAVKLCWLCLHARV